MCLLVSSNLFFYYHNVTIIFNLYSFLSRVEMCPEKFKHRYKQTRVFREGIFTRNAVQSVLSQVSSEKFFQYYELKVPEASFTYGDVQCAHNSIHVAGIYLNQQLTEKGNNNKNIHYFRTVQQILEDSLPDSLGH